MRVIAGTARGRRLVAPRGRDVRPTTDRVKEALFSSLQPRLPAARVLDLYAGSGALAIEALSRGAARATLVESWPRAVAAIRANLEATGLAERAEVVEAEVAAALARLDGPFDVVLADPPYAVAADELERVLALLAPLVAPGGTVRLERPHAAGPPVWPPGLTGVRTRRYGDTAIHEAEAGATAP